MQTYKVPVRFYTNDTLCHEYAEVSVDYDTGNPRRHTWANAFVSSWEIPGANLPKPQREWVSTQLDQWLQEQRIDEMANLADDQYDRWRDNQRKGPF